MRLEVILALAASGGGAAAHRLGLDLSESFPPTHLISIFTEGVLGGCNPSLLFFYALSDTGSISLRSFSSHLGLPYSDCSGPNIILGASLSPSRHHATISIQQRRPLNGPSERHV